MRFAWPALSLLLALAGAPASGVTAGPDAAAPDASAPDAARQQALTDLLLQDCGSCHGLTLAGGLGPALEPARLAGHTVDSLSQVILDGLPGTAMPPWRTMLSVAEARWLARRLLAGARP